MRDKSNNKISRKKSGKLEGIKLMRKKIEEILPIEYFFCKHIAMSSRDSGAIYSLDNAPVVQTI